MSLLIPELERQLNEAARARRAGNASAPIRRIRARELLMLAVTVLVTAAIAGTTIVSLSHRPTASSPAAGGAPRQVRGETTRFETCGRTAWALFRRTGKAPSISPASVDTRYATESAGSVGGHPWSLLARRGENGFRSVEDGWFVLDGRGYSMCAGFPNPAEFGLIDAAPSGIVYGFIASPGDYAISLHVPVTSLQRVKVLGGTFFIEALPRSACSYRSLDLTAKSPVFDAEQFFAFGRCTPGQLVALTNGHGAWGGQTVSPRRVPRFGGRIRTRRGLPPTLVAAFSVFRGMVSEQAKSIPNGLGWRILVVPETYQTCFKFIHPSYQPFGVVQSGGGDCVPNSMALAGKFSPAAFGRGETVVGLAPNGNRTVKLTLRYGSTETVPVSHNVYTAHTSRLIRTVTLRDSTGTLRTWNVPDGAPAG